MQEAAFGQKLPDQSSMGPSRDSIIKRNIIQGKVDPQVIAQWQQQYSAGQQAAAQAQMNPVENIGKAQAAKSKREKLLKIADESTAALQAARQRKHDMERKIFDAQVPESPHGQAQRKLAGAEE